MLEDEDRSLFSINFYITVASEWEHSLQEGGEAPNTQEVNRRSNVWEAKGPLAWPCVPVSLALNRDR